MPREHLDLSCHTRPLRVALLVSEIEGVPWQSTWTGALSALGQVWGGSSAVLIPYGPGTDRTFAWCLADVADPDWWTVYAPSASDPADVPPERLAEWERLRADAAARLDPGELEAFVDDEAGRPAITPLPVEDLVERLARRTCALASVKRMFTRGPLTTGYVPYPLVDVTRFSELPRVYHLNESERPSVRLLQAAESGRLTPRMVRALEETGNAPEQRTPVTELADVYGRPSDDIRGPWALTEIGCAWFRRGGGHPSQMTIVVGDRPEDFALAYLTRRARTFAWWLPTDIEATEHRHVIGNLARRARDFGLDVVVTSVSDHEGSGRIADEFSSQPGGGVSTCEWERVLTRLPNRLGCVDLTPTTETVPVRERRAPRLPSPIPPTLPKPETALRWMVQTLDLNWVVHRDRAAVEAVFDADWTTARSAEGGIAFTSPRDAITEGIPLPFLVPRPTLNVLEVLEQLEATLKREGWTIALSDKGAYATATIDRFGSPLALETALTDPPTAALLVGYLDSADDAPGCRLSDQRRYLTAADADRLFPDGGAGALSALTERGVTVRGVLLRCERCRHLGFYRARDIDPSFTCARCAHERHPTRCHWIVGPEPTWYYRLDEAVWQFIQYHGDLPLLALMERFRHSQKAVQIEVEVEVTDADGGVSEIDFVVVEGGRLWLGEGFTASKYEVGAGRERKRLGRLRTVAETLNAYGIQLHTAAPAIDERTAGAARKAFAGTTIGVELHSSARVLQ